jgi:WD40 repeat protein
VLLLAFAVIAGVIALIQRNDAKAQALTSDAERIGAQALNEQDVDRQLLLAVAAVKLQNRIETRSDLFAVLEKNQALIHLIRPFHDLLDAIQVSPDGRLVAVADSNGFVRFIDFAGWRQVGPPVPLGNPVAPRAMSFSPDGRTLMVVTVGNAVSELMAINVARHTARRIRLWRSPINSPPNDTDGVAYSPDGRSLAVSLVSEQPGITNIPSSARVLMLDARTGAVRWQRRYPVRSPEQEEPHVAFTPAGVLLTSAQHGDTILWNTRTGQIIRRFPIGGLPAISAGGDRVALGRNSPAAALVTSSWMTVLNLRTGRYRTLAAELADAWIRGVSFIDRGSEIVADAFDGVHVWDVASGTIDQSFVGQPGQRSVMAVGRAGATVVVGSQDGSVAGFDLSGRQRLGQAFSWGQPDAGCQGETLGPCDAMSPQSDVLADTQSNGGVALVNLRTLRRVKLLAPRDGRAADAVSFMPGGRTLIDGGLNGNVTMWDVRTGRVLDTLHFSAPVQGTAPSPDGKLLAVQTQTSLSPSSRVEVVRIATGKVLQSRTVPALSSGLKFTGDGRELVALGCCAPGAAVVAWDVRSDRQLFIDRPSDQASAMDIAPGSNVVAVGTDDGKLLFLDPRSGKQVEPPLQAAAGNIAKVSFSPDGRDVAVGASDNVASIWNISSRERLGNPIDAFPGYFPLPYFEPDGRLLVLGGPPETAVQWPTAVQSWERFACQAAGRDLTPAEWHDLLPNRSYRPVCGT